MARRKSNPADELSERQLSVAAQDPWVRLSAAVLLQGVRDAKAGGKAARAWLVSDDARLYAELLGIDRNRYSAWVEQHFKTGTMQ